MTWTDDTAAIESIAEGDIAERLRCLARLSDGSQCDGELVVYGQEIGPASARYAHYCNACGRVAFLLAAWPKLRAGATANDAAGTTEETS